MLNLSYPFLLPRNAICENFVPVSINIVCQLVESLILLPIFKRIQIIDHSTILKPLFSCFIVNQRNIGYIKKKFIHLHPRLLLYEL